MESKKKKARKLKNSITDGGVLQPEEIVLFEQFSKFLFNRAGLDLEKYPNQANTEWIRKTLKEHIEKQKKCPIKALLTKL